MSHKNAASDNWIPDTIASLVLTLFLLLLYLLFRAISLIVRAFRKQPKSQALWAGVIAVCVGLLLLLYTQGNDFAVLYTCTSFGALTLIAYIIDVSCDDLFQKPPETLVSSVLHHSWWDTEDKLAA